MQEIIEKLRGECTPSELSEHLITLAGEYSSFILELDKLIAQKAESWIAIREHCTSDTQATRQWERTAEGLQEMSLRLKMKGIEKLMSAIKSRLRVAELEANNIF